MRIPRIYVSQSLHLGLMIPLDAEASNHLLQVLRLRTGAFIHVFDGHGREFLAEIEVTKRDAFAMIKKAVPGCVESPLKIHLGQGISRGEKMDYTIQKAVELGVWRITPIFTEFTEVKFTAERLEKRMQRWRTIIISACEQCGRNWLPELVVPEKLSTWVLRRDEALKLILHPRSEKQLADLAQPKNKELAVLAGPEGGFSDQEVSLSEKTGFAVWQLGPRILRTETAAVAAIAVLQSRWGDMG